MSLKITYKGDELLDTTTDCKKKLDVKRQYLEDDVIIEYASEAPTLISKSIIANGTYNATDDNADGYSSVTVNVPDRVGQLIDKSISGQVVVPDGTTELRNYIFQGCNNITTIVIPSTVTVINDHVLHTCQRLQTIKIPQSVQRIRTYNFCYVQNLTLIDCTELTTTNGVADTVLDGYCFNSSGNCPIIFADEATMNIYKTATNWVSVSSRMTYVGA